MPWRLLLPGLDSGLAPEAPVLRVLPGITVEAGSSPASPLPPSAQCRLDLRVLNFSPFFITFHSAPSVPCLFHYLLSLFL